MKNEQIEDNDEYLIYWRPNEVAEGQPSFDVFTVKGIINAFLEAFRLKDKKMGTDIKIYKKPCYCKKKTRLWYKKDRGFIRQRWVSYLQQWGNRTLPLRWFGILRLYQRYSSHTIQSSFGKC